MQRWEYLYIETGMTYIESVNGQSIGKGFTIADYLNMMGGVGWEVVGLVSYGAPNYGKVVILKRPIELKPDFFRENNDLGESR